MHNCKVSRKVQYLLNIDNDCLNQCSKDVLRITADDAVDMECTPSEFDFKIPYIMQDAKFLTPQ